MNLPPRFLARAAWALAIAGCALAVPAIARAAFCGPAGINLPGNAKSLQVELGRAHPECTNPNTTHVPPLDLLGACAPPMPLSPYIFGPKGRGKAQLRKVSGDLRVKIRLRDVQDSGGNPANAAFQTLLRLRITDDQCTGICTLEDFGVIVPTPCVNGKCSATTLLKPLLEDILGRPGGAFGQLGPCMIAIPEILVLDDTGAAFAAPAIAIGGPAAGPHNVPRSAKRLGYDLGRAFAECTNPNTTHPSFTLDACTPYTPLSAYRFGEKGQTSSGGGKLQLKKLSGPDDVQIVLKLRDVRDAFNSRANALFKIELVLRITDNGCAGAPCTLEDFSVFVPALCTNGNCKAKTTLNTESPGLIGSTVGPSMIAIPEIRILDDTGTAFAEAGIKIPN